MKKTARENPGTESAVAITIKDSQLEATEDSAVKLTITVTQESAHRAYTDLVADYASKAHIKGFRRGHVPPAILEQKFGESMRQETLEKVLDAALRQAIDTVEQKPLAYASPELVDKVEPRFDSDLTFTIKYDVFPTITLERYSDFEVEYPVAELTEEDEQRELKAIQEQNAVVIEKADGELTTGDIATINYVEIDDQGEETESTRRQDFVFTVGTGYNLYGIDDDILGMKVGDQREITKAYAEDHQQQDLAGRTVNLRVTLTTLKERRLPDLDDDLAQDVNDAYSTIDDLKADIRRRLTASVEARVSEQKKAVLLDRIIEANPIVLPKSIVNAELSNQWRRLMASFNGQESALLRMLQAQGKTYEDMVEQWRPAAEHRVKGQLLVNKMAEAEGIAASDEDLEAEYAAIAERSTTEIQQVKDYYAQNDMADYLRNEIQERRLFDHLFTKNTMKEGEKVKLVDLLGRNA